MFPPSALITTQQHHRPDALFEGMRRALEQGPGLLELGRCQMARDGKARLNGLVDTQALERRYRARSCTDGVAQTQDGSLLHRGQLYALLVRMVRRSFQVDGESG